MTASRRHGTAGGGFTYVGVLVAIVVVGLGIAGGAQTMASAERREKERELLFVGGQFRAAIASYYSAVPGAGRYPPTLDALLLDPRHPTPRRHLRRLYPDPVTSRADWGLVRSPEGGIMGIHSASPRTPLKQSGFDQADQGFEPERDAVPAGLVGYQRWQFVYVPPRQR